MPLALSKGAGDGAELAVDGAVPLVVLDPLASELQPARPGVGALAVELALFHLADVLVPAVEGEGALAVHLVVFKLADVLVTHPPGIGTLAVEDTVPGLAHVAVGVGEGLANCFCPGGTDQAPGEKSEHKQPFHGCNATRFARQPKIPRNCHVLWLKALLPAKKARAKARAQNLT